MKKLVSDAAFRDALAVRDSRVEKEKTEIVEWAKQSIVKK